MRCYRVVKRFYEDADIEAEVVDPDWSTSFSESAGRILGEILERDPDHLFGHSWSAAAMISRSRDIDAESMVLASPSPVFPEDIERLPLGYRLLVKFDKRAIFPFHVPEAPDPEVSLQEASEHLPENTAHIYGGREVRGYLGMGITGLGEDFVENREREIGTGALIPEGVGHRITAGYLDEIEENVPP
jgi:hypothetical protein